MPDVIKRRLGNRFRSRHVCLTNLLLTRRFVFRFLFLFTLLLLLRVLRLAATLVRRWLRFFGLTVLRWPPRLFVRLFDGILLCFDCHVSQVLSGIVMNRLSVWLIAQAATLVPTLLRVLLVLVFSAAMSFIPASRSFRSGLRLAARLVARFVRGHFSCSPRSG